MLNRRGLPVFGCDGSDRSRECRMRRRVNRTMLDLLARRILAQKVVTLPVCRRPDGPGSKAPAAIWTNIVQHAVDAGSAKCTFIAANTCLKRVRGQRRVAVLTAWSQFEHRTPFVFFGRQGLLPNRWVRRGEHIDGSLEDDAPSGTGFVLRSLPPRQGSGNRWSCNVPSQERSRFSKARQTLLLAST